MRPVFQWQLHSRGLQLGRRTLIMGVVNVTPDSFFAGGRFEQPNAAVAHALELLGEGADILDVGGESTRPGATVKSAGLSAEQELRRIVPVIEGIKRAVGEAVISVDTYKASVARGALQAGAEIINDVSGLRWDAEMARIAAQSQCGVVLMHTRGEPQEWKRLPKLGGAVVELVSSELRERAVMAENAGISHARLVLDPGFGFGKNLDENHVLLARLAELQALGYPLLAGTSRKSFIGHALGSSDQPVPPEQRLHGTMATVAAAILNGAHVVRVHDVAAARDTAKLCDALLEAARE